MDPEKDRILTLRLDPAFYERMQLALARTAYKRLPTFARVALEEFVSKKEQQAV